MANLPRDVTDAPVIKAFVARLHAAFGRRIQKIMLFGSRARGEATEESDYDFLIVFDKVDPADEERLLELTAGLLLEQAAVITAIALTSEDLERRRYAPFLMNARREAVAL